METQEIKKEVPKKKTGLELLREPFLAHQISSLPKPYKKDSPKGNCPDCGGYHGLPAVHLDYVGHAALTDRLLDCDINWDWEPLAIDHQSGLPRLDTHGNLWIKLTVCGVTRLGYGSAPSGKDAMDRNKELIGDALRNAAMRFGAALDLWHKGDLHLVDQEEGNQSPKQQPPKQPAKPIQKPPPQKPGRFFFVKGKFPNTHFSKVPPDKFEQYYNDMILKDDPKYNDILARMDAFLRGEKE